MDFKVFTKSFFISIGMTLVLLFILSILLAVTPMSENVMSVSIVFISSISILVGGFLIGKTMKTKGIVYGAIFGLAYMLILYLISSIINLNFFINLETILMFLAGIIRWNDRWNFRSKFIKKP